MAEEALMAIRASGGIFISRVVNLNVPTCFFFLRATPLLARFRKMGLFDADWAAKSAPFVLPRGSGANGRPDPIRHPGNRWLGPGLKTRWFEGPKSGASGPSKNLVSWFKIPPQKKRGIWVVFFLQKAGLLLKLPQSQMLPRSPSPQLGALFSPLFWLGGVPY